MLSLIVTMKKISFFIILYSLYIIPVFAFSQFSQVGLIPLLFGGADQTGRRAAQDFYNQFPGKPIPLGICNNITELNENLWKPEDVLQDFNNNKQPNQIGFIVLVKTEACCKNQDRPCATTTAAFEKESTPLLDKFKIYGIQVAPGNSGTKEDQENVSWKKELKRIYQFKQGPGAKIVAVLSDGKKFSTDASALGLLSGNIRPAKLDQFLNSVIAQAPKVSRVSGDNRPTLYTEPDHCPPCRELERQLNAKFGSNWRNYINVKRGSPVGYIPYIQDENGQQISQSSLFSFIDNILKSGNQTKPVITIPDQKPLVIYFGNTKKEGYFDDFKKIEKKVDFFYIDFEKWCRKYGYAEIIRNGRTLKIPCPPNMPKDSFALTVDGKYYSEKEIKAFLEKYKPVVLEKEPVPKEPISPDQQKPNIPGNFDKLSNDEAAFFIRRYFNDFQNKLSFGSLDFYDDGDAVIYVNGEVCTVGIEPEFCVLTDGLMKLSDFKKKVNDAFANIDKTPHVPDPNKDIQLPTQRLPF